MKTELFCHFHVAEELLEDGISVMQINLLDWSESVLQKQVNGI